MLSGTLTPQFWLTISDRRSPHKFRLLSAKRRREGGKPVQVPLRTSSNAEAYIRNEEWRSARLSNCPAHPSGGCSLVRHGSYGRATPRGLRIARWYCPESRQTFSLLPDFLAARLPGSLGLVEDSVTAVNTAKSVEAAADALRGPDVTLPSAIRWLRRRIRAVKAVLAAVMRMAPEVSTEVFAGASTAGAGDSQEPMLVRLRRVLTPHILGCIPAPLGFQPVRSRQQNMGPDGGLAARYGVAIDRSHTSCHIRPNPPAQRSYRL
jgi:hypothetical protein